MAERPATYALSSLGCRANQEEIDALRSVLLGQGAREVPFPGPAEVILVNSCAVTASALAQSRQEIRRAARGKAGGILIVTGCGAQLDASALASISGVDFVIGNAEKSELPQLLASLLKDRGRTAAGSTRVRRAADPTPHRFLRRTGPIPHARARALLKIQDGCPLRCHYCVVSRLRGRPISRAPEEVAAEVGRLVSAGFEEIVLTGINLGLYGRESLSGDLRCAADGAAGARSGDATSGVNLARLLGRLESLPGRFRIRLSSLEPMTVTRRLLDRIAASERICHHFHLAMQSGDAEVLRRMGRPYGLREFTRLVGEITARMPRCGLGVDVIAGFPGESAAAFARTTDLLTELPVTYLHAFAYSERPGTVAAELPGALPERVRKERVRALRRLDAQLRTRFRQRLEGARCELLIESVSAGRFQGLSREYVRMIGSGEARPGELRTVVAGEAGAAEPMACAPSVAME